MRIRVVRMVVTGPPGRIAIVIHNYVAAASTGSRWVERAHALSLTAWGGSPAVSRSC